MADDTQSQVVYEDGTPIPVGDVARAVAEGKAYSTGDKVRVTTADGKGGSVDPKDLANVMANQGARIETQAEAHERKLQKDAESIGGMAKTAGEATVRGATLGFGDLAHFYDKEGKEAALARQRFNPKLSTGFELGGAVGSGLLASALTGGAGAGAAAEGVGGALARAGGRAALAPWMVAEGLGGAAARGAGRVLGEGLVGKAAQLGARGLAEGAVMGAGHEVSQAALKDVPLTAERLLAGAWESAEAGGLLGAGAGVLGGAASRAARALKGSRTLQSVAESAAAGAAGGKGRELGRELLGLKLENGERVLRAGAKADEIAARVSLARQETTGKLASMRAQADAAFAAPDLAAAVSKADDVLQPLRGSNVPAVRVQAARMDDQLQGLREAAAGTPIKVQMPDGSTVMQPREPLSFGQLEQMTEGLAMPRAASPEVAEAFSKIQKIAREPLDEATKQALGESASAYRELKTKLARLTEVEGLTQKAAQRASESGGSVLSDIGMGSILSAATGNLGGLGAGLAAGVAKKLVQERGQSLLAVVADRAAQSTARLDQAARVAAMVEPAKHLPAAVGVNVARLFDRYSKDLDQPDEEVAARVGAIAGDLNQYSPELAAAVTERHLEDREYLKSIAPQPTTNANQTLTPKATKASYSFDQKKQFVDSAVALERPLSVFEDIARGELPLSKIEALKERRPLMWQEMRTTVVRYTAEREEELPYSRRMLLGVAFDFPADWSMVNVGSIQETVSTPEKAPTDPRAAPSKINDDPGAAIEPGGF